jgi:hypothetical protein
MTMLKKTDSFLSTLFKACTGTSTINTTNCVNRIGAETKNKMSFISAEKPPTDTFRLYKYRI